MNVHLTARQRARQQITDEILDEARRHLAVHGAAGLSLRSVARELGMVSSAVYRYFASRDELLTRLIVDAYDSLGATAEAAVADSAGRPDAERWVTAATAIRAWALEHPHEYTLLYGTPVPGYSAPDDTVAPGTRVSLALMSIVAEAAAAGRLGPPPIAIEPDPALARQLDALSEAIEVPIGPATLVAVLAAWTQLFGLLGFELTNQTRGMVDDHAALLRATAELGARAIGLSS